MTATIEPSTTDWRTTRKAQTFHRIQEEAMRLFLEKGYDGTTVEEIAAAAGVSHMTVFRHFPTKEALVLSDEYDPLMVDAIRHRPPTEPALDSVEHAIVDVLGGIPESELELHIRRSKLIHATPALEARMWAQWMDVQRLLAEALAERSDPPRDPADFRIVAAIAVGIAAAANQSWIESGHHLPLGKTISEAFATARRELVASRESS